MRVVFLGSPAFAVPSLAALAADQQIEIPLVVTQPNRPAGRGRTLTPPAVKIAADELGIPVYQPDSLRNATSVQPLRDAAPDLVIVVAYGELLRRNVLDLTRHGCLNVHPSLLPRYRGAAPIPAAILNGDRITGVSIIKLVRRLDAGPVVAQVEMDVLATDTTATLGDRLATLAAAILPNVARRYVAGELVPQSQDESAATYTHEWSTIDAQIDWNRPAVEIERLVRAADPWPIAWTLDGETRLRVLSARPGTAPASSDTGVTLPGTIAMSNHEVEVQTGSGRIVLEVVQPAGKRTMPAGDWWRGTRRATARLGMSLEGR